MRVSCCIELLYDYVEADGHKYALCTLKLSLFSYIEFIN